MAGEEVLVTRMAVALTQNSSCLSCLSQTSPFVRRGQSCLLQRQPRTLTDTRGLARLIIFPNSSPRRGQRPWMDSQGIGEEEQRTRLSLSHEATAEQILSLTDGQQSWLNHNEKLLEPPGWCIPGQTEAFQPHRGPQD